MKSTTEKNDGSTYHREFDFIVILYIYIYDQYLKNSSLKEKEN